MDYQFIVTKQRIERDNKLTTGEGQALLNAFFCNNHLEQIINIPN